MNTSPPLATRLVYPGSIEKDRDEIYGYFEQSITIPMRDGTKLHGWFFLSRSFCSSGLRVLREWDECRRYDFYGHSGYFPLLAFHELSRIRQQSGRTIGKTDCRGCLFFYPVCSESCEGGCWPIISDWVQSRLRCGDSGCCGRASGASHSGLSDGLHLLFPIRRI